LHVNVACFKFTTSRYRKTSVRISLGRSLIFTSVIFGENYLDRL